MAKTQKPEESVQDTISLDEHDRVLLMDRYKTWHVLSRNRSIQNGDPITLIKAADEIMRMLEAPPVVKKKGEKTADAMPDEDPLAS